MPLHHDAAAPPAVTSTAGDQTAGLTGQFQRGGVEVRVALHVCSVGHGANQSQTYHHSQHAPLFASGHRGVHLEVVGWKMQIGRTSPDAGQIERANLTS